MDRMMTVCCKGNEVAGFIESLTSGSYEITVCGEIDDAFYDCRGLTQITLPDSVTKIGMGAFYGCTALKTAYIPKKLDVDRVFDDSTQVVRK